MERERTVVSVRYGCEQLRAGEREAPAQRLVSGVVRRVHGNDQVVAVVAAKHVEAHERLVIVERRPGLRADLGAEERAPRRETGEAERRETGAQREERSALWNVRMSHGESELC